MANITINITFDFTVSFDEKESEYSFIHTRKDTNLKIASRDLPCKNSYTRTTSNLPILQVKTSYINLRSVHEHTKLPIVILGITFMRGYKLE